MTRRPRTSTSAFGGVAAAALLALTLGACGLASAPQGSPLAAAPGSSGMSNKEFIEATDAVCKDLVYDLEEARDDIRGFERQVIRHLKGFDGSLETALRVRRSLARFKQSVRDRLHYGKVELAKLYEIDLPSSQKGRVDEILSRWNEAWVQMRAAKRHLFLWDGQNYRRAMRRARALAAEGNDLATDYGLSDTCRSSWRIERFIS